MSVDKDTVRRIAKLARLALDDARAEAMVTEIDRPVDYRPVESDGAARAAALLAELL